MKFVAADMDGTLLDSQKRLPSRLYPAIRALEKKGVRFAVASGRQYYTLLRDFPGLEKELLFIAENGGMVFDGQVNLYAGELEVGAVRAVVERIRRMTGADIVLCGIGGAYIEASEPPFLENVQMYYARYEVLPDVTMALEKDRICKLAIFDSVGAEHHIYPILKGFSDRFNVNLAGESWVDLMAPGVSKGSAIRKIQEAWGIGPEECMAFGDYLNDFEMMQACGQSYAMANAHPDLKAICNHEAKSNDEDGVIQALVEAFSLELDGEEPPLNP